MSPISLTRIRTGLVGAATLLAASLLLAACGSSASSTSTTSGQTSGASASAVTVKTASGRYGTVLVTGSGMTLYHLGGEGTGRFICTSAGCTSVWHPLAVSSGNAPTGTNVSSLGVVRRPDGTAQVTYEGEPLYTFAADQHPGETRGQGLKDIGTWSVVTISTTGGAAVPTSTSTQSETTSKGGGYSY
jgi:predicted lipoprotein with Yx(FWY)xxD motif